MLDEYDFGHRKWQEVVENPLLGEPECRRGFTGSFYRLFFTDYKLWNCRIFPARWLSGLFSKGGEFANRRRGTLKSRGNLVEVTFPNTPPHPQPQPTTTTSTPHTQHTRGSLSNGPALRGAASSGRRAGGLAWTASIVCRVAASTNMVADGDMRLPTMWRSVPTWAQAYYGPFTAHHRVFFLLNTFVLCCLFFCFCICRTLARNFFFF